MTPDDVAQVCHDGEGVDASAMHGYQSAWMAHWMHTSCRSAAPNRDNLLVGFQVTEVKEDSDDAKNHDLLGGSEVALDGPSHAAPLGEGDMDAKVTFISEADCGKSKKSSFGSKSFSIFGVSQKTDGILSLKREQNSVKSEAKSSSGDDDVSLNRTGGHFPSTSAHAPPKTSVGECQLLSQGILPTALVMKSPNAIEQINLPVSTSLWNEFVKSDSAVVPNVRDKGKGLMPPFTSGQPEINQSSYNLASQEHFTATKYHSCTSLLIREKKRSGLLDPQRSSFSRWIQSGITHSPQDPIAGSDDEPCFVHGQHDKIHNYIANASIKNQTASSESTKPQKFCGGSSLVPQLLHDVETVKIYPSIDSAEESSRGHPKISQTTHHFLTSKKTDVDLSDRGQFFIESIGPAKFKGNSFNASLDFCPPTSDNAMEVLKLEAPGSSTKSEGKENVQDLGSPSSLKNESSAETDTMDIHALHENHLPGDVLLHTNKYSKDSQNSPMSQVAITSAIEKGKAKSTNMPLPDINQEPPEHLTLASPVVDKETSTSRTHSLGVEDLLSHADEHSRSKSGNSSLGPDPWSRWVKRLKLCTLGSACGTKNAKIGESSSHEKVNNNFTKNMKGTKTSMEPEVVYHAEGQMIPDQPARVLTNGKSSFNEAKRAAEITLSHPWIQRWTHRRSASFPKRQLHDPKSSNTVLEEFQKEQFPSIAAMALMGKAMNSLNPSQLTKKGPIIVWNAKGF